MYQREVTRFRTCIYRAGTSKGIFLHENDLPQEKETRDQVILAIFGSPDRRQIDGLGGADVLTSKLALISPSSVDGADVDYTFGQVDLENAYISYSGLCGNISSGIASFAIEEGLVRAVEPVTTVRIHSKNTDQIYITKVPIKNGMPLIDGDCVIPGVPGSGAKLEIDMAGCVASMRKGLLPTGNVKDELEVEGIGKIEATLVDVVNPCIFIRAKDIGLTGKEVKPSDLTDKNRQNLENIRKKAFQLLEKEYNALDAVPFVAFVAEAQDYPDHLSGETISAKDVDFLSRIWFLNGIHQTYPGSMSCCTGACAVIPGSILYELRHRKDTSTVRIGHPAGVIDVEAECSIGEEGSPKIDRISYGRTARRLMDGYAYVPNSRFMKQEDPKNENDYR